MKLSKISVKRIIAHVVQGEDYRVEVNNLINEEFLLFAIDFFKKVATAKLESKEVTIQWYKDAFLNGTLSSDDIAINAGLNRKTISNMYNTASRQVVIDAAATNFELLYKTVEELVQADNGIGLTLTIKLNGVAVDLNVNESLIVINTLAVKRAALRGGAWSTAGKQVEKYLMLTLCRLYCVPEANYNAEAFKKDRSLDVDREVDFYLKNGGKTYRCEVKLMGKGNTESADAIIARDSNLFVADMLSQQNKAQCDERGVKWVCLRDTDGYKRFDEALKAFDIPHKEYTGVLKDDLSRVIDEVVE